MSLRNPDISSVFCSLKLQDLLPKFTACQQGYDCREWKINIFKSVSKHVTVHMWVQVVYDSVKIGNKQNHLFGVHFARDKINRF